MTPHDDLSDTEIDGWLTTLGITTLCQWDVLVLVYRHQTSLVDANMIAHLLGYASDPVVAALDVLAPLGLVERSRVSQVARLYEFTVPSDPQRRDAWIALQPFANHSAGRVRLTQHLRGDDRTAQMERNQIWWLLSGAQRGIQASQRRLQPQNGGPNTWLKAI